MRLLRATCLLLLAGCPPIDPFPCPGSDVSVAPYLAVPEVLEIGGREYRLDAAFVRRGWFTLILVRLEPLDGEPLAQLWFTEVAEIRMEEEAWAIGVFEPVTPDGYVVQCKASWPEEETSRVVVEVAAPGRVRERVAILFR